MGGFSAPAGIVSLNSVNGTFVNGVNGTFAEGGYMVADAGNGVIKQVGLVLRGKSHLQIVYVFVLYRRSFPTAQRSSWLDQRPTWAILVVRATG